MNFRDLQRILKNEEEVIICTIDGIERRIFTESVRFDLDMKHIYLKKLKVDIENISHIKKIENKKDVWIINRLEEKERTGEEAIIAGEDFQVTGIVLHLDKETVVLKCVSFDTLIIIKLDKIASIY